MTANILYDLDWILPLRNEWLTAVFKGFTHLGYTGFFFAALPLLYWCWNKDKANRIATLTLIAALLMFFLKNLFQDPRPPATFAMEGYRPESFGLPSGHTFLAIVFWGGMAGEIRTKWFTFIALVMIIGIAFSRLYLGVHDLEDILGGAIPGGLLLAGLRVSKPGMKGRSKRLSALLTMICAFALPLILWGLWDNGEPPGKFILMSSFFIGWQAGRMLEQQGLDFTRPQGWRSLGAALTGVVILAITAAALKSLLETAPLEPWVAQITGGLMIGLLITWIIPVILVKTGITQRSKT
ncbi:MAG: phosphatase PAP2 family protein [Verrucomicrobiales bacterium]|nr:phosphatase PAP2 family protein [Verrucomicrobiales bacterium]